MAAVLKIGGSLSENPANLTELCHRLSDFAKVHKMVIVPGGAEFADTVRKINKKYRLSNEVTHKMAILAMDQYGLLLSDTISESYVTSDLKDVNKISKGKIPIFLPSQVMFHEDPLENSWDVTSDSIAAYVAGELQAEKLVLVTDVDGIFLEAPKTRKTKLFETLTAKELQSWNKRTSVDKTLPKMLQQIKMKCYVVNGNHPERIKHILENKKTVCTQITSY
ncbi:MAG: hypothetical protein IAX21_01805 [Candidatus Bathyarchaeota archaeon]|nr:MAG: hypothetical protein IAX21_01805 [Candidatus Bathyarchaeota archaeon]